MVIENGAGIIIRRHKEQHYYTFFNKNTGFFARIEEENYPEPFWSKNGPELLDISITNWCDKSCHICYKNSNKRGKHMTLKNYQLIMQQAKRMGVLQVALGGGNTNQHPSFIEILKLTRKKYGIIPSYTTNGRGLTEEILKASQIYCGAVAVSAYNSIEDIVGVTEILLKNKIKTNIQFVLSNESIEIAINWLNNIPKYLRGLNAIIFLNYKPVGKHKSNKLLLNRSKHLEYFFSLIKDKEYPFKIGFDSCCVSGLVAFLNTNKCFFEACEAARFSAYISEDLYMYPCSFMGESFKGVDLKHSSIKDCWVDSEIFNNIRSSIKNNSCIANCSKQDICYGGCPVFPKINLCSNRK